MTNLDSLPRRKALFIEPMECLAMFAKAEKLNRQYPYILESFVTHIVEID